MKDKISLLLLCAGIAALCGCVTGYDSDLVFYESFDTEAAVVHPEVGPAGAVKAIELGEGVKGKALMAQSNRASVTYAMPSNFIQNVGCIEFWAKIDTKKSDFTCSDPRLYWYRFENGEETQIEYSANNGLGNGGLYGRMIHFERTTHRGWRGAEPYSNVLGAGKENEWHHYAITWNKDGLETYRKPDGGMTYAVLFVDGHPVQDVNYTTNHTDDQAVPAFIDTVKLPGILSFPIPVDHPGRETRYRIDEFKIWKKEMVDFTSELKACLVGKLDNGRYEFSPDFDKKFDGMDAEVAKLFGCGK